MPAGIEFIQAFSDAIAWAGPSCAPQRFIRETESSDRNRAAPPRGCPRHDARALTGPGGEADIVLDGKVYHLRITKAGKLILNK